MVLASKKNHTVWAIVGCLLVGGAAGFAAGHYLKSAPVSNTQSIRENTDQYKFIHPLLAVSRTDMSTPSPQYTKLAGSVNAFIAKQKASAAVSSASVYFVNYGKSGSFAINQNEAYDPASMLKVVIMVAYLKESDTDPAILDGYLTFTPNIEKSLESVPFQDPSALAVGQMYSVESLIERMIIDSDNGAMNILLANIDDAYLSQVYVNLGLEGPEANSEYKISANDYSLFFRVLYNGTYLSNANSEKALSILSKSTFADGLVAGLPSEAIAAHKFGEHVNGTGDHITSVELHDCGIIYTNGGPYLLCVMTKGASLDSLKQTISGISKLVYQAASAS